MKKITLHVYANWTVAAGSSGAATYLVASFPDATKGAISSRIWNQTGAIHPTITSSSGSGFSFHTGYNGWGTQNAINIRNNTSPAITFNAGTTINFDVTSKTMGQIQIQTL